MTDALTLVLTFAVSLGLTLLLEAAIALPFRMRGRDWLLFLLVNLLTNPAVVYLNLLFSVLFPAASPFLWQIPLELLVIAVEGLLYARLSTRLCHPLAYAALANALSYGTGLILNLLV